MTTCSVCRQPKYAFDYYVSNRTTCRECVKRRVRANRRANIDAIRVYDRTRSVQPHRKANVKRVVKAWRAVNVEGRRAHVRLARAVKSGVVVKPTECEGCGNAGKVEAHHHDYSKPLVVAWLCKPCHAIADKIRRKFEAA